MDSKPMRQLIVSMVRDGINPPQDVIEDFFQSSLDDKVINPEKIAELFIDGKLQSAKLSALGKELEKKWPDEPLEIFCYAAALNSQQNKKPQDFSDLIRALQKKSFETRLQELPAILQSQLEASYQQAATVQTTLPNTLKAEIEPLLQKFYSPAQMVIGARLDVAYEIYNKTSALTQTNPNAAAELQSINQKSLDFMQKVLNINDASNLAQLMQERQQKSKTNPEYIPNRTPQLTKLQNFTAENKISPEQINKNNLSAEQKDRARYNLQRLAQTALAHKKDKIVTVNEDSKAEDALQTTNFLTPAQRDKHRAIIKDGELLERQADNTFTKVDTNLNISHQKDNYIAYVLNVQGELSLFNHFDMADKIAHSSMNAQSAVLSAGELKIENGIIKELTAHSGHYRPFEKNIYEALKYLTQQGVDISQIDVHLITVEGQFSKKAAEVYADMDKLAKLPQFYTQSPAKVNSTSSIMQGLTSQSSQDPLLALLQKGTVGYEQIASELGTGSSYVATKLDVTSKQEHKKDFAETPQQRSPTVR